MIERVTMNSNALHGEVMLKITVPSFKQADKVLFLLHGSIQPEGNYSLIENMPRELSLQELCDRYHLIVVTPYMKNCFYISSERYNCNHFIARELPEWISARYSLSEDIEYILSGISMGGYGAILIGAHTDRFHKIISISGAFIPDDIMIGNPEIWGDLLPNEESTRNSFLFYFLPLTELQESVKKNVFAALDLLEQKKAEILITCGTKDWMYSRNKQLVEKMKKHQIRHESIWLREGEHDSDCFRDGLWQATKRLFEPSEDPYLCDGIGTADL